jgi:serine/threonine protein kinase
MSEARPAVMICPSCKAENQAGVEVCFTCGRSLMALTHGFVLASRYEILSPLGKGGMGLVYKALDRILEETVAIKVLRTDLAGTEEMGRRFRSEIKLARKVSHRNVCRIHEYGEDGGVRFISMEWVEGVDLKKQLVERKSGLPVPEAYDVAVQIAEGLEAIHDVGIVHRDLKTQNVMRDARGFIRLMDFGIAKELGQPMAVTSTGQIMGTPEYMSPEQCRGEPIDFRSDIYALGVVIYEIFTGQVPFRGDTPVATLFKHIQDPIPIEGAFAALLPTALVPVLRRALAKERTDRYANAAQVAVALRKAYAQTTAETPIVAPPPAVPEEPEPEPAPRVPSDERRRDKRLDIYVNLTLKTLDAQGRLEREERTIAENISRGGARVMTAMPIEKGAILSFEEVGGSFKTRAEVRNAYVGKDKIRRLNLQFLDREAPDRLVRTDDDR